MHAWKTLDMSCPGYGGICFHNWYVAVFDFKIGNYFIVFISFKALLKWPWNLTNLTIIAVYLGNQMNKMLLRTLTRKVDGMFTICCWWEIKPWFQSSWRLFWSLHDCSDPCFLINNYIITSSNINANLGISGKSQYRFHLLEF